MEKIRRQVKLFWVSHGGPIKLTVLIIAGIIFILRGLNELAIENQNKKNIELSNQVIKTEESKKIEKKEKLNEKIINDFIKLCKDSKIEEAYSMLSKTCKENKFLTVEEFKEKYIDKTFEKTKDIEIEYDSANQLYKIIFYEDMLESGKINNRDSEVEFYEIVQEENDKIYIHQIEE